VRNVRRETQSLLFGKIRIFAIINEIVVVVVVVVVTACVFFLIIVLTTVVSVVSVAHSSARARAPRRRVRRRCRRPRHAEQLESGARETHVAPIAFDGARHERHLVIALGALAHLARYAALELVDLGTQIRGELWPVIDASPVRMSYALKVHRLARAAPPLLALEPQRLRDTVSSHTTHCAHRV
jgi:hypothetical protein